MFGNNRFYPHWFSTALGELSFPFVLASLLLFILFWHEMMTTESVVIHPFINKMRIPFYVVSGLVLALQIVRIIVFSLNVMDGSSFITCKSKTENLLSREDPSKLIMISFSYCILGLSSIHRHLLLHHWHQAYQAIEA
jgi:hypothetical protein